MPALPSNKSRRKGVTPIKKPNPDNVWQRTLVVMGLEPLSASSSSSNTSTSKAVAAASTSTATADPGGMAAPTPAPELTQGSQKKLTILDLPVEAQKDIFKHSSNTDLLALCLVSKHFRDLAAERLYRKFEVTFSEEPDDGSNPSSDALAGGLETLVASDYDYAKYLRDIVLEPMNAGDKGEHAYRYYMYDSSCGKFMNTLFLLALRKARSLETFKWDIRVELSRPVFKALHQVRALQHLHIRMQAGHSMYQTSPTSGTLQYSEGTPVLMLPPPPMGPPPGFGPPPHNPPSLSVTYPSSSTNIYPSGFKYAAKLQQKTTKAILPKVKTVSPTIAGFKNLKTLSILDMDTLDYVEELRVCVRNSSSTLSSLTLSFSEALASKSRKPPPEVHSDDDSEAEDEFGQLTGIPPPGPPPPGMAPPSSDASAPTKALKAQEEKKKQDDVLNRIFSLKTGKKPKPTTTTKDSDMPPPPPPNPNSDREMKLRFFRNFAPIAQQLMQDVKPGSENTPEGKKALELIKTAAKLFSDGVDKANGKSSQSSSSSKETPDSSTTSGDNASEDNVVMSGGAEGDDEPGLFDEDPKKKSLPEHDPDETNPDDIDIEEPEGKDDFDDPSSDTETSDENPEEPSDLTELAVVEEVSIMAAKEPAKDESPKDLVEHLNTKADSPESVVDLVKRLHLQDQIKALVAKHSAIQEEGVKLRQRMGHLQSTMNIANPTPTDLQTLSDAEAEFKKVSARLKELSRSLNALNELVDDVGADAQLALQRKEDEKMVEYVRTTRGLTLNSLAIYLIPVRGVVLSTAIDLHVLQSITLLNVGPQIGIWNLLYRENKIFPLPLKKIYTDNVTVPFLQCAAELDCITELLLLEKQKGRVESTAAKTTVTIEQIRKAILKKHAPTLKVLMIKHDSANDWDLNVKTTLLLCHRAKALEELSVSFGVKTMHCLLQNMPSLTSLRALHTNQFRTDDTCMWVMREFKGFTKDNVAHNPDMKLEYLALQDNVDRLVRRSASSPSKSSKKGKGKGKAKQDSTKQMAEMMLGVNNTLGGDGAALPPTFEWQASSEEDEGWGVPVGKAGLKVETVEGVRFGDVSGVRIFERDVVGGRL